MRTNILFFSIIFFLSIGFFFNNKLKADAGPKPSMKFKLIYEFPRSIKLIDGYQLECDDADCTILDTLKSMGPQGFICFQDICFSNSYGYKDYHKIILIFDDTVRTSNIFKSKSYRATFDIIVKDKKLEVIETTSFITSSAPFPVFIKAFVIIIILELIIGFFFLLIAKKPFDILTFITFGNIISVPLLWYLFPMFFNYIYIAFGGIIVFVFESYFIYFFCKDHISIRLSFLLSFTINFASLTIGTLLLWLTFI